jgi:hypothetical protein
VRHRQLVELAENEIGEPMLELRPDQPIQGQLIGWLRGVAGCGAIASA